MSKIAYYPGCSGMGTSFEYDQSTRAVCRSLGVELVDVKDWSCCGSSPAHTVNHVLSAALSARNLVQAEAGGMNKVATPCPSCLVNLRTADLRMEDPEFRAKVNALLDLPYKGGVETQSVLQVLSENVDRETLASKVVKPLTGLKIACYYGCIMNRPPDLMCFDHHENPMAMDNLISAMGAEVVPFPLKVECCGASFGIPRREIVMKLSGKLLDAARRLEADAIVTACPLCQMNLDMRQGQINDALHENFKIPVFYYTQLIGYALGVDRAELGFKKLCVDPRPVLGKIKQPAQAV
jgi:heterodisulfide reductase subunit B